MMRRPESSQTGDAEEHRDDQAEDIIGEVEVAGAVLTVVAPLVEPARALAGATF